MTKIITIAVIGMCMGFSAFAAHGEDADVTGKATRTTRSTQERGKTNLSAEERAAKTVEFEKKRAEARADFEKRKEAFRAKVEKKRAALRTNEGKKRTESRSKVEKLSE